MYRNDSRQRQQYFYSRRRARQQPSLFHPSHHVYYQFPSQPPYVYNEQPLPQQLNFPHEQGAFMPGPMHYIPQQLVHHPPGPMQQPPNQPITANIMQQFQDEEGQIDINKMLSTVGQLANTVQQVSPVIKQFGSLVNSFRS